MTTKFAANTTVPVIQSRGEIERLLSRHRCSQFSTGVDHDQHRAIVQFKAHNRIIKFEIRLPDPADKEYRKDRKGWVRGPAAIQKVVEQDERQKWRALLLVIRAKLEAVENGISTFEDEFMAHILLPNMQTVGQLVHPLIERAYETGKIPDRLLLTEATVEVER